MASTKQAAELVAAYQDVIRSPAGKQILKDMYRSFARRPSYAPGQSFDETAFKEGQRDVYLRFQRISGFSLAAIEKAAEKEIEKERERMNAD